MTSPHNFPPTRVLVFVGFTLAIAAGVPMLMYVLSEPAARPDLLTRIGTLIPGVMAAFYALLSWLQGKEARESAQEARETAVAAKAETAAVREIVERVDENVNGKMDRLMDQANGRHAADDDRR